MPGWSGSVGVVASLFFVAAAGCLGGSSDTGLENTQSDAPEAPRADVSETAGGIQGLVTDDTLFPLQDALVTLTRPTGEDSHVDSITTGSDGVFAFSLVPPGTYSVTATVYGYEPVSKLVQTSAGEVREVMLVMTDLPSTEAYVSVHIEDGMLSCALALVVVPFGANCQEALGSVPPREHNMEFPAEWAYFLFESDWDQQNEMIIFYFYPLPTDRGNPAVLEPMGDLWSKPVARMGFAPGEDKGSSYNATIAGQAYLPVPKGNFTLQVKTYWAGLLADEADTVGRPVCTVVYGRCLGAGTTLGTRYTTLSSIFVNGLTIDIDGYTALPDQ